MKTFSSSHRDYGVNPKLPAVTSKQLAGVAQHLGFKVRRQTGSHAIYVRSTTIAV
jgi:predicted RNA binding protein YcfA (HicA-like mRNA interferase family)